MEHLKTTFHQALADPAEGLIRFEDGHVHIHEGHWAPQDLLLAMGQDAYDKEFRSWLANYREQLLERGREIVEQFDQEGRFNVLKAAYKRDALVPFERDCAVITLTLNRPNKRTARSSSIEPPLPSGVAAA